MAIVLDNTVLNIALKTISEPHPAGLGASQSELEWAINAYTLAFAGLLVPESRSPSPGRIDYLGVLLSIVGLVLLVYGIIQGGETGHWLRADVLGPAVGGLAVLALFAWYEARIANPSLDVKLFRDPR